ncbi:MAG TPA: lamin tail domain-containing protein [Planctomycetota bacterium]|nr:lamin tail domain-containing protein [Planctomycetota bacterium]
MKTLISFGEFETMAKIRLGAIVAPYLALILTANALAQDYSVLRINEVIADNATQNPADKKLEHQDMVEIYNGGDAELSLANCAISDTADAVPPYDTHVKAFPSGTNIPAKGFVVVFLSGKAEVTGDCQTDIDLGLAKDGSEPVTLWGPRGTDGKTREIIDQVWLPPLPTDVSFGRFPDGSGPAPVAVEETLQVFHFYPKDTSTFGTCGPAPCGNFTAPCKGSVNGPGGNVPPRLNRIGGAINHPAAGEPVDLVVQVEDDKDPIPSNIPSLRIEYSVDGVAQTPVAMEYDAELGVQTGASEGRPLHRWTHWRGSIPGQPASARVEFKITGADVDGATATDPSNLCAEGVGPCNELGLPGANCVKEPDPSLKFVSCSAPFRYTSGYEVPEALRGLVINEVMATQTKTYPDRSGANVEYDDYIELFNGTSATIDLSGFWLSDKPFEPQGWQFPAGSSIAAGAYEIVWLDNDGGRCPRPPGVKGDGQECPDPTNPAQGAYHTNFALDADGDQIYLFAPETDRYGLIHGVEFGPQAEDVSLSLSPNGDRNGEYLPTPGGTPGLPNGPSSEPLFRRGDSNGDCAANLADAIFLLRTLFQGGDPSACPDAADMDDNGSLQISDAVYLLNYLFQGGAAIPPPGESVPGADPTSDSLDACQDTGCG